MINKPTPYQGTEVSASKSQEDIKRLLRRYGCGSVATAEELEKQEILLKFTHLIEDSDQVAVVRLRARVPPVKEPRRTRYNTNPARARLERQERAERQAWRTLYYAVKSRMESILYGMETFEEAFLSHVEVVGPQGTKITFGEWALPLMRQGRLQIPDRAGS